MSTPRVLRPEIQALRAAAVLIVVLYHLWPQILTGGFVGVDVFFVISGFLITGQLLREVDSSGGIRLARFWARRARRLLPAALLVLLVSAIAVLVWVPQIFWAQFFRETVASALYVQNWVLAADSVNYLAANNVASAAQHYWSLSVEEQFYLVWPLLILAAAAIVKFRRGKNKRRTSAVVLSVVVLASLVYSIVWTAADPAAAYFITPTRAWEFGAGGLLALVPVGFLARGERVKPLMAWLGWALIAFAAVRYSASTPFPGYTALVPVVGTVAVIWAGAPRRWWSPTKLTGLPPVQWLGDVSYSVYLWHWPLIVVAPYVLGYTQLALVEKTTILALSILLAWLTKIWIEDPARSGQFLIARKAPWTFGVAAAAMLVVIAPSLVGGLIIQAKVDRDNQLRRQLAASPCFGAASLDPAKDCTKGRFPVLTPDPALAPQDSPGIYFTTPSCLASGVEVRSCEFGNPHSSFRVALIGDSHAAQWEPALRKIAEENGWDLQLYLKTNCAFTDARRSEAYADCAAWSHQLTRKLAVARPFDLVLTSFFAENLGLEVDTGVLTAADAEQGFRDVWKPLIDRGTSVVAIHDTPHMLQSTTVCVAQHGASSSCDVPTAKALTRADLQFEATRGRRGVWGLDMTPFFCNQHVCPAVIGGVALHTDPYHMTKTYSLTLAPYLYDRLKTHFSEPETPPTVSQEFARDVGSCVVERSCTGSSG